ncbi:uncharacterized protein N7484_006031 [Penicillium longicatenatum]|uniref:uncharacterized protein n=1 Tax=Penicillium longicatenatum TaxID=1561947 RepID=UPI0025484751|nr:uncharacterized protein N7484_006031 [Penicillium longicatenatum]KAJ5643524.1 hypothetical protein N7484_006031 [Penicillium longicatenatum]
MTQSAQFKFSTVTGFFLQDEPDTDPATFDYVESNFGLILHEEAPLHTQWQKFIQSINELNNLGEGSVQYKVLFLGRHGEGVHNVAEKRYGKAAWDSYWSLLDGDQYGNWVDARLTDLGRSQARTAHDTWETQFTNGIPAPQSYYVSPLHRTCETAEITFKGLDMPLTDPFRPMIKELLRETLGEHTCDRRSKASEIGAEFPEYQFELGFSEDDLLWDAHSRETNEERNERLARLLNDIFASDENVILSLTAHSGAIASILKVVGHRDFPLQTGAVIPVVVQAERR